MIRCRDCDKSIDWDEATDTKWTNKGFDYDGLCYKCKKQTEKGKKEEMRLRALEIIERYK